MLVGEFMRALREYWYPYPPDILRGPDGMEFEYAGSRTTTYTTGDWYIIYYYRNKITELEIIRDSDGHITLKVYSVMRVPRMEDDLVYIDVEKTLIDQYTLDTLPLEWGNNEVSLSSSIRIPSI